MIVAAAVNAFRGVGGSSTPHAPAHSQFPVRDVTRVLTGPAFAFGVTAVNCVLPAGKRDGLVRTAGHLEFFQGAAAGLHGLVRLTELLKLCQT